MAYRDRLAASRAQREQPIELSNVTQNLPDSPASQGADLSELSAFLAEDASIQEGIQQVRENISRISALRTQSLNAIGDASPTEGGRIDALTTETRELLQDSKERVRHMESTQAKQDAQLRKNRIALLRTKFLEVLQDYQREEQESRAKSKQRIERQLLIVKPDATPEEVAEAVDGRAQQIFSRALTQSTRYGESRAAYREVEERQADLQRVERTLAELAQLFSDMGNLAEQQDVVITTVESTARGVHQDTERALENTEIAVRHARSYRKTRIVCAIILLLIAAIVALTLGLVLGKRK